MEKLEFPFISLIENDPKGIWVVDNFASTVYCNKAFRALFALSEKEAIGMHMKEVFGDSFVENWQGLLDNGGVRSFTIEKKMSGVSAELKIQGYVMANAGNRNVVFQFLQATTLFQKDGMLQTLIDAFPDAIYYKDLKSRFILSNKANNKKLAFSSGGKEVIGKTDFDLFSHHNAKPAFDEEQEIIATGKAKIYFEKEEVWPDGTVTWSSNSKMPLHDANGEIVGIFGIGKDITEEKKKGFEIDQLNRDLDKQVSQLKMVNQELKSFSYSVSHDLRAPLRAIDGFSRIILEDYGDNFKPEVHRLFNLIIKNSKKMNGLISDLLSYTKLNQRNNSYLPLDLNEIIDGLVVELDLPDALIEVAKLPLMKGDGVLMKQVFANLISNAIKFSAKEDEPKIKIGSVMTATQIEYYVKDNGVGFNMKYYDKIFGIFQRLHSEEEFEGTGVGLAIVQKIIQSHHGQIWAKSEPEKGATFYFSVPII